MRCPEDNFRPKTLSFLAKAVLVAVILTLTASAGPPVRADTFLVTNLFDAIPAPEGSLRAAIERSEENGEPDGIVFLVEGGRIELVAPLPDLLEGRLNIGQRRPPGNPPSSNGIVISGVSGVERAVHVRSRGNVIGGLDFVQFDSPEVVLIEGNTARENLISGCVFGRDNSSGSNTGAAVRIRSVGNEIHLSRFVRNGVAVAIETGGQPALEPTWTRVHGNWIGTNGSGGRGLGNGEAIHATGQVFVTGNRFSGPGLGVTLGPGSHRSIVAGNEIGVSGNDGIACSGFDGAAIRLEGSGSVEIRDNRILCSQIGIYLGTDVSDARILDNRIGGAPSDGHRSDGIAVDGATGTLIRGNRIAGNEGFGVYGGPGPASEPLPGTLIACNSISDNGAGALALPGVATPPPVLTSSTVVSVEGDLADPAAGWVEVFGDDGEQARVFQGAVAVGSDDPPFRHRLPVLGLRLDEAGHGTELAFDREVPANHVASLSKETTHETTELSAPLPAATDGLVFDVIRGELANLSFGFSGGIDLGPVKCLEAGLPPGGSPPVVDPEEPPLGSGFFYLVRRRDETANAAGTYDPAICLTDVDEFQGPRRPASGDCPG